MKSQSSLTCSQKMSWTSASFSTSSENALPEMETRTCAKQDCIDHPRNLALKYLALLYFPFLPNPLAVQKSRLGYTFFCSHELFNKSTENRNDSVNDEWWMIISLTSRQAKLLQCDIKDDSKHIIFYCKYVSFKNLFLLTNRKNSSLVQ